MSSQGGSGKGPPKSLSFTPIGKRSGVPTRAVKNKMEMPALVDKTTASHMRQYVSGGRKHDLSKANVHAAHRLSDKHIRRTFGVFASLTSEKPQRVDSATYSSAVKSVVDAVWDPSKQTKRQNTQVTKAVGHLDSAFKEKRPLSKTEYRTVTNAVGIIANTSLRNIRGGFGPANSSIGEKADQGIQHSPGGRHLQNTPNTKRIRRAIEGAEATLRFEHGTLSDFRTNPRTSQNVQGRPSGKLVFSPLPQRSGPASRAVPTSALGTPKTPASSSTTTSPATPTRLSPSSKVVPGKSYAQAVQQSPASPTILSSPSTSSSRLLSPTQPRRLFSAATSSGSKGTPASPSTPGKHVAPKSGASGAPNTKGGYNLRPRSTTKK